MTVSLDAALNGLKIAQQSLDTISNNIANAGTVGYTRKILPQETTVIAGSAVGVQAMTLKRVVDNALIGDVNRQTSRAYAASVQQSYYQRIQDFHGAPNSGQALSDQVTNLANTFTQLSLSPNDPTLLGQVVNAAQRLTDKINDFATLLTSLRAKTENDINQAVGVINQDLNTIAQLNVQISSLKASGKNTVDLEDKRDVAINEVSKYMQTSTFTASNGTVILMTKQGQVLADNAAHPLYFSQSNMLPTSYYPGGGLSGLYANSPSGTDIAQTDLGGQLGSLFTLRDQTLPTYTAQLDEFSQKMADRFQSEGLKLFTDANGNVPASASDPTPVDYVGFSNLIQVNSAIVADPTLIRNGTTGNTEQVGSNEVISRVAQFAFGSYKYQQATSTLDVTAPVPDFITGLGLTTNNRVTGTVNLSTYAPDISTLPGATFPGDFDITLGLSTQTITVVSTDTAASIVSKINTAYGATYASVSSDGAIAINFNGDITLADNTIGATTMNAMGLSFGTTTMPNPSFQVQVGTRTPVTISVEPGDTSTELLAKLNAVPGLTATLDGSNHLVLTPTDGGSLKFVDGAGAPLTAFGLTTTNVAFDSFRQNHLGPSATLSTGLLGNSTLHDFIASSIADQSEAANLNKTSSDQETDYLNTLETRNTNISGVNIDQEMSDLIRIQSAYAASAKSVTVLQTILQQLMDAVK